LPCENARDGHLSTTLVLVASGRAFMKSAVQQQPYIKVQSHSCLNIVKQLSQHFTHTVLPLLSSSSIIIIAFTLTHAGAGHGPPRHC
jgi:hypothetical protein